LFLFFFGLLGQIDSFAEAYEKCPYHYAQRDDESTMRHVFCRFIDDLVDGIVDI